MHKVFISSTSEDLKDCRQAARNAASQAGDFEAIMMEYTTAQGALRPYESCMEGVAQCDVVVVIVAHRYGSIPPDQPWPKANRTKSITWLECKQARRRNIEVLAFLMDETATWPAERYEAHRIYHGIPAEEVLRNVERLREFKSWLSGEGFRGTFTNAENLQSAVVQALTKWKERQPGSTRVTSSPPRSRTDPRKYLAWLREQTAWIDIRGLLVGSERAHRFPIDELYIGLTMSGALRGSPEAKGVALEDELRHHRLVILGDPGSGKTTFLRRVAFEFCRKAIGEVPVHPLALPFSGFPLWLRISDLEQHIEKWRGREGAPRTKESPAWLPHFFKTMSQEHGWDLDGEFL